jgi:hypothetical protein
MFRRSSTAGWPTVGGDTCCTQEHGGDGENERNNVPTHSLVLHCEPNGQGSVGPSGTEMQILVKQQITGKCLLSETLDDLALRY